MQGCKPILAIQSVIAQELPDVNDATQYQLALWMDNPRLADMRLAPGAQIADKDRVLIRAACGLFKKFRAKMTEYGNQLFRPADDIKQAIEETEAQKEKKPKKKRARTPVDEDKPKKKTKKKDNDGMPKRPLTSYMTFVKMNRQKVLDADPSAVFTEVGRKLGAIWKNLTPGEQKKYHDLAREDQERFGREMRAWEMSK